MKKYYFEAVSNLIEIELTRLRGLRLEIVFGEFRTKHRIEIELTRLRGLRLEPSRPTRTIDPS